MLEYAGYLVPFSVVILGIIYWWNPREIVHGKGPAGPEKYAIKNDESPHQGSDLGAG